MSEFFASNWIWILLIGWMVAIHLGHLSHRGRAGHSGGCAGGTGRGRDRSGPAVEDGFGGPDAPGEGHDEAASPAGLATRGRGRCR